MVMIELSETEKPGALPPPKFSSPFASPSLRWAGKKRLRCFHPDSTALRRLSPSPDRLPFRPPPSLDADARGGAAATFAKGSPLRLSPSPSLSPSPCSARARILIRLSSPRSEEGDAGEPLGAAPDPSSRAASDDGRTRCDPSLRGIGCSLRSAIRNGGEEKGKKQRRRVELWVSLSRDEIEEDFLWMTGAKPPRRSRRRDRGPSDHFLMGVFPGSWMPNKVTPARYRVSEPPDPTKD